MLTMIVYILCHVLDDVAMRTSAHNFMLDGVEDMLTQIGTNIKKARLRRNMTIHDLANRIHVDNRTISRMEKGDPSTSLKNVISVLVIFGLEHTLGSLANPEVDEVGLALENRNSSVRARLKKQSVISDDF